MLELDERYRNYVQEIITNDYSKLYMQLITSTKKNYFWFLQSEIQAVKFDPLSD